MKHKRAEDLGEGICPFQLTSNFKNPSPHPLARNRSDRLSVRSQPPPLKVLGSVRTFFKPLLKPEFVFPGSYITLESRLKKIRFRWADSVVFVCSKTGKCL